MNTKFDVGQRVTYPVVHTADGNITGIAVSKAGVARYAIGPKWYTEDDLKLTAEKNPDAAITATEPVSESKPEPVKLYGIKNDSGWVTKGKIYEFTDGNIQFDEFCGGKRGYDSFEKFKECNTGLSACLVPLVQRPAKAGESAYISAPISSYGAYSSGEVVRVEGTNGTEGIYFRSASGRTNKNNFSKLGLCFALPEEYLVLDGYTGDPV